MPAAVCPSASTAEPVWPSSRLSRLTFIRTLMGACVSLKHFGWATACDILPLQGSGQRGFIFHSEMSRPNHRSPRFIYQSYRQKGTRVSLHSEPGARDRERSWAAACPATPRPPRQKNSRRDASPPPSYAVAARRCGHILSYAGRARRRFWACSLAKRAPSPSTSRGSRRCRPSCSAPTALSKELSTSRESATHDSNPRDSNPGLTLAAAC